ncbi:class I SAM-dependent methyltransferase [Streptomyces anulatus]|uniref:class I SAM-dependent methyltransferase n=1 Tax=Streptomyces anulatus TaxID=1892 RepID=UPI0036FD7356
MIDLTTKNRNDLVQFYSADGADKPSIFEVWENGGSRNDSVTPSTYSPEYQRWIGDKLIAELEATGGGLLSVGCGNAVVESQVAQKGFRVLAMDAMEEATSLARRKGLDAVCADIYEWEPDERWSVIYIDGVLGHLLDENDGLTGVLSRIRSWLGPALGTGVETATLLASNDAPSDGSAFQKAPRVNGFHWLSGAFMREQVLNAGFDTAVAEEFRYHRPISGERTRAVVTGRVLV